uniref:nuclear envelope integral membrane protein 1-like n=1 Tax=Myxine glutinosa TaxID=7769 RepID=UPI0035902C2E
MGETSRRTTITATLHRSGLYVRVAPERRTDSMKMRALLMHKSSGYNLWLIGCLVLGLLLVVYADYLSRSAIFLSTCGFFLGVLSSLLLIVVGLCRLLPAQRNVFFVIVASGWSMALFTMRHVYRDLGTILSQHWLIAIGYFVAFGCISSAVCYWHVPLRDESSILLLRLAIQLISHWLIHLGIQIPFVSYIAQSIVLSVKFFHLRPEDFLQFYRECRQRWWTPPLTEVLGETEYQLYTNRETKQALRDLRHHCQSPESDAWEIMSKLNSQSR